MMTDASLVEIPADGMWLEGELVIPDDATGLVIFAHGSGSSRLSPRNIYVAEVLQKAGIATLLVDLLSRAEDEEYRTRFNIDLLTERLGQITDWVLQDESTTHLAVGYFGASTGAAAAMIAAEIEGDRIKAVVSRGGRVDLAGESAELLKAPTLFIVGQDDSGVREANEEVFRRLECEKQLAVVAHATHLFEEPGTLERVAELAADWFRTYLGDRGK